MEFPDDFNTPTFPAGPHLMTTRVVSVATMVVFFLIVCVCGLLLWTQRSVHVHPFLVSVNPITGQWDIVGHNHGTVREVSTTQTLQESVLGQFVQHWFAVSSDADENAAQWASDCSFEKYCGANSRNRIGDNQCALYCLSASALYETFINSVVPDYSARVASGETLYADMSTLQLLPLEPVSENGGNWQIRVTVYSNLSDAINILAYAQVGYNSASYPQTLGYYVSDFNAYRTN